MRGNLTGTVFETREGWSAITWSPSGLRAVVLPRKSEGRAIEDAAPATLIPVDRVPEPWRSLVSDLVRYFSGDGPVDFSRYHVDLEGTAPFTRRVYEAMRGIPWGCAVTYGELAALAGNPAAARAVGQACARNPVAVVIPCHRVVGATGLTGFGGGLDLKKRMLSIEGWQRGKKRSGGSGV